MSSSRTGLLWAMLATSAVLSSSAARAQEPAAVTSPPPSRVPSGTRKGLVLGGALLFVLPYVASSIAATTGYTTDDGTTSARGFLFIPAVGPFMMMGNTSSAAADVFLVLDGLAQVGGLTMFVYGLTLPKSVLAGGDPANTVQIAITPLLSRGASGATFVAKF
jgi:hypothetical protein